jgi:hypothetical protein
MTGSRVVTFRLDAQQSGDQQDAPLRSKPPAFFNEAPAVVGSPISTHSKQSKLDTSQDSGSLSIAGSMPSTAPSCTEIWRKYGKLYRAKIIMEDEENGGNTFVLSGNCRIERYYSVAEKVSS